MSKKDLTFVLYFSELHYLFQQCSNPEKPISLLKVTLRYMWLKETKLNTDKSLPILPKLYLICQHLCQRHMVV